MKDWKTAVRTWEQGAGGEAIAVVDVDLYCKVDGVWSMPVAGTGGASFIANEKSGLRTSDEAFKMAYTDAISVCCKMLGIGANVYWQSGRTKYESIEDKVERFKEPPKLVCEDCGKVIVSYTGANGKPVDVNKHIERSKAAYGKALCIDCVMKRRAEESNSNAAN